MLGGCTVYSIESGESSGDSYNYTHTTKTLLTINTKNLFTFASLLDNTLWFDTNFLIGSSILFNKCRDHVILPATGGRLRETGGSWKIGIFIYIILIGCLEVFIGSDVYIWFIAYEYVLM